MNKIYSDEFIGVEDQSNGVSENFGNTLTVPRDRHLSRNSSATTIHKPRRMHLKLFVNESTFSERVRFYFIKNQTTSLRIRLIKMTIKLLTVILYIIRAALESPYQTDCCGICPRNGSLVHPEGSNPEYVDQYTFSWYSIFFVDRPAPIWYMQVILACMGFTLEVINTYAQYKGNLCQQLTSATWLFELFVCSGPFIVTICWKPLRCLFVPTFLNIWLAKSGLESIINDLHRVAHKQQSAMFNQVALLLSTLLCLLITCVCGVQHLERAGKEHMDLFDAVWFSVVTFSTVGYGDITPTIWLSKLLVVIIIIAAIVIIPSQVEQISILYLERQRQGGEYSRQRAKTEKHVVVCSTALRMDVILDFLNEFYAHPVLQNHYVVLLSPMELHGPLQKFLQIPIWAERVIYIQGSVLRDNDLKRVKMDESEGCFILTSRQETDRVAADEKTILRAMAVKDYAPGCPLYVQILRPESILHVQFADKVVCDEEFKYVLLGMNSYIPAISTLITLLAHTSKGQEGENLGAEWKRHFGRSAGNEIYSVTARDSKFFGAYIGYKFPTASSFAHSKYGATLFAIERSGEIRINPGNEHVIDPEDTLFYICLTQEEDAIIVEEDKKIRRRSKSDNSTKKKRSTSDDYNFKLLDEVFDLSSIERRKTTTIGRTRIDFPPTAPYVGHNIPTMCHILEEKAPLCCLRLDRRCEHTTNKSAFDYNWMNPPILVSAEFAPQSLFNVMLPLRAYYRPKTALHPIILLLEHSPDSSFLSAISCFPMVYYMLGGMDGLDSFLIAGVLKAHSVIILDRESSMYAEEEYMADARQLVASQTVYRLFPSIPTCMELTHATNMRFMHFHPTDKHSVDQSDYRKNREKEKECSLPYLFRKSFASGKVFSSSMLDTLLYQSFVKDYLITLLRIMLGLQYTAGSGYLSTYKLGENEVGKTYQDLFSSLSRRLGYVVLGVYRYVEEAPTSRPRSDTVLSDDKLIGVIDRGDRKMSLGDDLAVVTTAKRKSLSNISLSSMKKSVKSRFSGHKKHQIRRLQLIQSTKSEREKLDEMIQSHMQELDLVDEALESPSKAKENIGRFGHILLNPFGDLVLKKDDILYVIKPEINMGESRPTSCFSEPAIGSRSYDDLLNEEPIGEEGLNNNFITNESKRVSRRHSISAIDEEECRVTVNAVAEPILQQETSPV